MPIASRLRSGIPLGGVAWMVAIVVHFVLQCLSRRGVAVDPILPLWMRASLLATEAIAIAVAGMILAVPLAASSEAADRSAGGVRAAWRTLRFLLLAVPLLAAAASWGSYWIGGQFLDRHSLRFFVGHAGPALGYALRNHPLLTIGIPAALLAVAVVGCEKLPGWLQRRSPVARRRTEFAALLFLGLATAAAAGGDVGRRYSDRRIPDPEVEILYPIPQLYGIRRQRSAGPLTHAAITVAGRGHGDLFDDGKPLELYRLYAAQVGPTFRDLVEDGPPSRPPELIRRPIMTMDQYLAAVDRDRLRRWNVVLILVDSLRADQLRITGGRREVMPALEALAREGRAYPDCTTQATHTDLAWPSVVSSHYPLRNRWAKPYPLNPSYPRVMIYDLLKALGWRTAMFSSGNENWSRMVDYLQTGSLDFVAHAESGNVAAIAAAPREPYTGSVDDGVTMSAAMDWIDASTSAPFFLYMNLQNSHLPYPVPPGFRRPFGPEPPGFTITHRGYPPENRDAAKEVYADSLAYVDTVIARLIRSLREKGSWDRTLIVVTGDHGESFYEHGEPAHANGVFEEVLRVPLVLRAPGLEPAVDPRPAQLIDVAPAILDLLGLPPHPSFQGENLVGPAWGPDRARFQVSQPGFRTHLSVLRSGFKLIRTSDSGGPVLYLYDLARDPGEREDLSKSRPDMLVELREWLTAWRWIQLDYYADPGRHAREYPPILRRP